MQFFYVNVIERNAPWGAECSINAALQELGHETTTLDFRQHRGRLAKQFLSVPDFDVFLLQRGDHFPLSLVQACNRPRLFWASELVARRPDQEPLLSSRLFDHVFLRTPRCVETVVRNGWLEADRVSLLLSAFDEHLHRRLPGTERDIDVLFVGSITERRRRVLDGLKNHFTVQVRRAFGEEMVRLFNRARVVLNIHAASELDTETRVYEALGCGALVVTERLSPESPFTSGEHLIEVASEGQLAGAVQHVLAHEDERERIAARGNEFVRSKHTYTARATEIAAVASRYVSSQSNAGMTAVDKAAVRAYQRIEPLVTLPLRLAERARRTVGKLRPR